MKLNFSKKIIVFLSLFILVIGWLNFAQAQSTPVDVFGGQQAEVGGALGLGESDPRVVVANVIRVVLGFLGIIAVGLILYAGWSWMTAAGNTEQISKAKKILTSAVIGLIIILSAFAIASFVLGKLLGATGADNGGGGGGIYPPGGGAYCSSSQNSCVPDDSRCNINQKCGSSCICTPIIGSPCDGDINSAVCEPNSAMCGALLTCDQTSCTCLGAPIIENISPRDLISTPNGAPGNFITINGQFFGNEPGTVTFLGIVAAAGDDKNAPLASTVNTLCVKSWEDNQIIVVVPEGAVDGPIQVVRSDGQLDTTENDRGPQINNFDVNSLVRPGICLVDPSQGGVGVDFNLQGASFGTSTSVRTVFIGSSTSAVIASNISNWSSSSVNARVPAATPGQSSVFVKVDNESSNELSFLVLAEDSGSPLIDWISPVNASSTPNGAPKNFITIGGQHFGTASGTVTFLGTSVAADDRFAPLASTINVLCVSSWKDNQIIVAVPEGGVDGPIKVIRADGLVDTTNDGQGVLINDFDINTIVRPGLCLADPDHGKFKENFVLQGNSLDGASQGVFFGSEAGSTTANVVSSWTNTSVEAVIPDLAAGSTKVFVSIGGQSSNFLGFDVTLDQNSDPVIDYIEPGEGPVGQYITIYGKRFGSYSSTSTVKFYASSADNVGTNADIDFPLACQDSWWRDTYIVVKVPSIATQQWFVKVTNNENKKSNSVGFGVVNGDPGPGICALIPHNGPVGQSMGAFGGNFGAVQGVGNAKFFNNKTANSSAWSDQAVTSTIPVGAETGPFKIYRDSFATSSNSLPFTVGSCLGNTAINNGCEPTEVCCAADTQKNGICLTADANNPASVASACGGSNLFNSCAFSWNFTTAPDPTTPLTCAGFSDAAACIEQTGTCPNSPGQCQTAGDKITGRCDVVACETLSPACASGACSYVSLSTDPNFNKCKENGSFCEETRIESGVTQTCNKVGSNNYWQIDVPGSCPLGTYKDINNFCTVGTIGNPVSCSKCSDGLSCNSGVCVVEQQVCSNGSVCTGGQCVSQAATCECCCRIEQAAQDCCLGLSCGGTCGGDTSTTDGPGGSNIGFGQCTGCTVKIAGTPDQAASTAACNCSGHTLKTCDMSAASGLGVCVDAGAPGAPCTGEDPNSCQTGLYCDPKTNTCTPPGPVGSLCDLDPTTLVCQVNNSACAAGLTCDSGSCTCQPLGGVGASCDSNPATPACEVNATACAVDLVCKPASCTCQPDTGSAAGNLCQDLPVCTTGTASCGAPADNLSCLTQGPDCRCCCTPGDTKTVDAEPTDIILRCVANKTPCGGDNRGLFCGCTADAQCVGGVTEGCGIDTCCRARPTIISTVPAQAETDICRNPLISATFNQLMDSSSFSSNFIVVGDYDTEQCPAGTTYLTLEKDKNMGVLARAWGWVKNLFADSANAVNNKNFCAVTGSVGGYNNNETSTTITFASSDVLAAAKDYYVIIKGDDDTVDNKSKGVLNVYGIGMANSALPVSDKIFNAINYSGYVWKFTTKPIVKNGAIVVDDGICRLETVEMEPSSYSFFTAENNVDYKTGAAATNDDAPGPNYDMVNDNDKIFIANAKTSSGQSIVSIPSYSWSWSWKSDNNAVAQVNPLIGQSTKVVAQNVQDGKTFVKVEAKITIDTINSPSTKDEVKSDNAAIHVFLCANPWPSVGSLSSWPWEDKDENCSSGMLGTDCVNNNFEFYYCRDTAGGGESNKQLEAITAEPVTRGKYDSLLKEFYFLRAKNPNDFVPALIDVVNQDVVGVGGRVYANWTTVLGVDGYKLYYGTQSGSYSQSITKGPTDTGTLVPGLTNGQKYYFVVTGLYNKEKVADQYNNKLETAYSNEISVIPSDTTPPSSPILGVVSTSTNQVTLNWSAGINSDPTDVYRVYYGTAAGIYGAQQDLDKATTVTITNLTNGVVYYFGISAIDATGNESDKTTTDATP